MKLVSVGSGMTLRAMPLFHSYLFPNVVIDFSSYVSSCFHGFFGLVYFDLSAWPLCVNNPRILSMAGVQKCVLESFFPHLKCIFVLSMRQQYNHN